MGPAKVVTSPPAKAVTSPQAKGITSTLSVRAKNKNGFFEESSILGNPSEVVEWAQGCIYSCQKCKMQKRKTFTTKDKGQFKDHLRTAHAMTVNDYRSQFESVVTQGKFHLCLICGSNVVHDEKYLTKHLKTAHDTTLVN